MSSCEVPKAVSFSFSPVFTLLFFFFFSFFFFFLVFFFFFFFFFFLACSYYTSVYHAGLLSQSLLGLQVLHS